MPQEPVRVTVTVSGGVCEAHTCPSFVELTIIDYDNLEETEVADIVPEVREWLEANDPTFLSEKILWEERERLAKEQNHALSNREWAANNLIRQGCLCQLGCSANGACPLHGDKATDFNCPNCGREYHGDDAAEVRAEYEAHPNKQCFEDCPGLVDPKGGERQ